MILGFDLDDSIHPLLEPLLKLYNAKYDDNLKFENVYQYDLKPLLKPVCRNVFQEFLTDEFYDGIEVYPDAKETIYYLHKHGHEIQFVTRGHPHTAKPRDNLLTRSFTFYKSSDLILCHRKQMLKLDALADDYEGNLIGGDYRRCLITRPWNQNLNAGIFGIERIFGWDEVPKLIEDLERRRRIAI